MANCFAHSDMYQEMENRPEIYENKASEIHDDNTGDEVLQPDSRYASNRVF